MENDPLAPERRRIAGRLFRLAPLVGVRGLTLDGLSRHDLEALNLLAQHVEQELASAKRRAREPWHWPRPGTFGH
jgi:hypothetical protein